jgi:hypothetical protein
MHATRARPRELEAGGTKARHGHEGERATDREREQHRAAERHRRGETRRGAERHEARARDGDVEGGAGRM